jgi:hypothetical protein
VSDEKVLTKEIAEQFLADEDSVDPYEATAIEDDAAESLGELKKKRVSLHNLIYPTPAGEETIPKDITCEHCDKTYTIHVNETTLELYEEGRLSVQDALHANQPWERELLFLGTCDECWDQD